MSPDSIHIYKAPKPRDLGNVSIAPGAHLTVSDKGRIYLTSHIVRELKLRSFPPSFGTDNNGNWYLIIETNPDNSFHVLYRKSSYFFNCSDLCNKLLISTHASSLHFKLEPQRSNPLLFKMVQVPATEQWKKTAYSKRSRGDISEQVLSKLEGVHTGKSYYETLLASYGINK